MIAFYLRLSIADGDLGKNNKDESNSIENQRSLLQSFIEKMDDIEEPVKEYIDDGYTGTNFNRPGFRQMIEDAKKGEISIILTKDLSRLGRDYIGVGDYLEQIFPVLGIRFIAVASNYDSDQYVGKTIGLDLTMTNLINNLYSRDISKKVTSALKTKWKKGICTTVNLPYGYIRDKQAKGTWGLDPETSGNVRMIFEKTIEGWGTARIAELLNELKVDTPGMYREKKGKYFGDWKATNEERLWDTDKVLRILNRYEYTGAFVNHYRQTVRPGSKKNRKIPENERYITEDAHDAIITKEEFENAQANIKILPRNIFRQKREYLFRGKIRCGNCKLALQYTDAEYDSYYYCAHHLSSGSFSNCCADRYMERELERVIKNVLDQHIATIQQLNFSIFQNDMLTDEKKYTAIDREKKKIDILKAERIRQYEAYAEGMIEKDAYIIKKNELTERIELLQESMGKRELEASE